MHTEANSPVIRIRFQYNHSRTKEEPVFSLDIDTTAPGIGITAIFGASGSGKTTLLRCLAGLITPASGLCVVNNVVWQDNHMLVPTHKRGVSYVFQESNLFTHLNVRKNLDYGVKRCGHAISNSLFETTIDVMDLGALLTKYPEQLSGGERQRVAIARVLLTQPKLLLMDEPLSALDIERKREILPYLERIRHTIGCPMIYVSHSVDEIKQLADHVMILDHGKLVAEDNVFNVFSRTDLPIDLGEQIGVVIQGKVSELDEQWQLVKVTFAGGNIWVPDNGFTRDQELRLRILARDVSLSLIPQDQTSILNCIEAVVIDIELDNLRPMALIRLKVGENYLIARVTRKSVSHLALQKGQKIWAQVKSIAIVR